MKDFDPQSPSPLLQELRRAIAADAERQMAEWRPEIAEQSPGWERESLSPTVREASKIVPFLPSRRRLPRLT